MTPGWDRAVLPPLGSQPPRGLTWKSLSLRLGRAGPSFLNKAGGWLPASCPEPRAGRPKAGDPAGVAQGLGWPPALGRRPQLAPYLLLLSQDPGGFRPLLRRPGCAAPPPGVLELIPSKTHKTRAIPCTTQSRCWGTGLGGEDTSGVQGPLRLHREFETSLSCMRPCLQKRGQVVSLRCPHFVMRPILSQR